ncbi:MAG TPA: heavy metal-associated domain-containing protein [Candidatus Limnocylindria bacterium]|nr:heavy metal-associated domain-containing protein [Candidatus Limnocylindria bacterium]
MKTSPWNSIAIVAAVLLLAVGGPWLFRELRSLPSQERLAARSGERVVTIEVSGMTCGGCAARVQGNLASLPGVSASEVRIQQDRAYVVCDRSLPDSSLVGAIQRAGPGFLAAIVPK